MYVSEICCCSELVIQLLLRKQEICLLSKALRGKIKSSAYKTVSLIDSFMTWLDLIYCSVFRSNCLPTLNRLTEKEGYRFLLSFDCINCTLIDEEQNISRTVSKWGNSKLWAASGLGDLETRNKAHKNQMLKNSIRDSLRKGRINHLTRL